MTKVRKSQWHPVYIGSEAAQAAVKSWFETAADDLNVTKAEILENLETGTVRKFRLFGTDADGVPFRLVRARTSEGYSLTIEAMA